ncbi:hypothetical protein ACFXPN_29340 [Streptomyces griseorubiginosus]|uniref:hypothetical protein n=1 Tax=Streptomyces griseorubiginosus TaxID=67304 RepID=UPI00368BBEF8
MADRLEVIRKVLVAGQPVRPLLAYEQSGPLVQLLASHTTLPTWQAPPTLLAKAIDLELVRAEEKDIPTGSSTSATGPGTAFTPHALVLTRDEHDFVGTCRCGRPVGRAPQGRSVDGLVGLWEQHAAQADPDAAWVDAVTSLHPTSIGAS